MIFNKTSKIVQNFLVKYIALIQFQCTLLNFAVAFAAFKSWPQNFSLVWTDSKFWNFEILEFVMVKVKKPISQFPIHQKSAALLTVILSSVWENCCFADCHGAECQAPVCKTKKSKETSIEIQAIFIHVCGGWGLCVCASVCMENMLFLVWLCISDYFGCECGM